MQPTMRNQVSKTIKNLNSEEGFAIPIALGMGLIMILLATTAIVRSQSGRVASINKKATAQSLAAAEAGIARIQDSLNNNRAAASYQACGTWSSYSTGVACTDTGTTISWGNAAQIPNLCSTSPITAMANNRWTSVDSTDARKGEYKLVSYTAAGILTVNGRVSTGQSGEAESSLQVSLPVNTVAQEQAASLWVNTTVSSSPQINSDVVGPCGTGSMTATFPPGSDRQNFRTNKTIPTAPTKPTIIKDLTTGIANKTLPETGDTVYTYDPTPLDTSNGDEIYQYHVSAIDGNFRITAGKQVAIWVDGNIDLSNRVIANQCNNDSTCGPFDFRIYGTGAAGSTLTLNQGSVLCDVFFHLPNYDLTFTSGGTTPTLPDGSTPNCGAAGIKNTGVYWVNKWSGTVASTTIINPARAKWGDIPSDIWGGASATLPIPPRIGPFLKWDPQTN
jgi:Tfp pilus assembly protein PilX